MRRSPAKYCYSPLPLDLHVLGLPLAFILSQDQTLHCNNILLKRIVLFFLPLLLFACIYYKHATLGFCNFNLLSLYLQGCPPCQLRVQRYELFLFYQTFFHLFLKLFYNYSDYQYLFFQTFFIDLGLFYAISPFFNPFFPFFQHYFVYFYSLSLHFTTTQYIKCFFDILFPSFWNKVSVLKTLFAGGIK